MNLANPKAVFAWLSGIAVGMPEVPDTGFVALATLSCGALGVALAAAIIGDTAVGQRLDAFRLSWWIMVVIMATAPLLLWLRYPAENRATQVSEPV